LSGLVLEEHPLDLFLLEMRKEYDRHEDEKGDSWLNDSAEIPYYRVYSPQPTMIEIPMDVHLEELLTEEFKEYFDSKDPEELIDIANFCAMLYLRRKLHQ